MPVEDLISRDKQKRIYWAIRDWKLELEKLMPKWELIGKYHERLWFQRMMHMEKWELLCEYQCLARSIIQLEEDIEHYKGVLYRHSAAVEELRSSMDPFKGISLKDFPLTQTSLF